MKKLSLNFKGKEIEVWAQKIKGRLWFHYQGETFQYIPRSLSSSQKSQAGGGPNPYQIMAPMPGKIIKVFVKKGEAVSQGQTLVAMEAMKMEYQLKAEANLLVKSLHCKEGQMVSLGEVLIDLEGKDGSSHNR